MFNGNHVCAIAAMAAISMVSLAACSESSLTNTDEPVAYSERAHGDPYAQESSSSGEESNLKCEPLTEGAITR